MLNRNHPWYSAQEAAIQLAPDIQSGFDIGFDRHIPEETKNHLKDFVAWVEKNFEIPTPLWVDFEYRHYLISRSGKRVGYLFYWSDFPSRPVFCSREDMPIIRLPVRTEHSTLEEILTSFIEAISCYFAWLSSSLDPSENYNPDEGDVEEILQAYLNLNTARIGSKDSSS